MRSLSILVVLLLGLSGLPRGFAQGTSGGSLSSLPELGDSSANTLSPQMEKRIGEEAMREIRAKDPSYVDDPEVAEYLNSLGRKLVASSSGASQRYEFFLIKDDTINAFAMPGGFVGAHTGLLLAAQTESELASVLAHEISHVTQHHIARLFGKQSQLSAVSIAGLLLAILAARSGSAAGQAAMVASQAGAVQAQLGYSRDFEREADRVGFQVLQQAGFDVNGMVSFFERLQRATRIHENNAPAYLLSHPLTGERIADIQNRVQGTPYKQHADSIEFQLVRAKLRSQQGTPREALAFFEEQLREKRYSSEVAARYGLASSLERLKDYKRASAEVEHLRTVTGQHPVVELLYMRRKESSGDVKGARDLASGAVKRQPSYRPFRYAYLQFQQALGQHQDVLSQLEELVRTDPRDSRVYYMQAQSYAAIGRGLSRHRAQAEVYFLQGAIPAAIEQLQLAQRAGDGDFYQLASIDARLKELRALVEEEKRR